MKELQDKDYIAVRSILQDYYKRMSKLEQSHDIDKYDAQDFNERVEVINAQTYHKLKNQEYALGESISNYT